MIRRDNHGWEQVSLRITKRGEMFVEYMRHRNIDNLEVLLSTIRKMLSELYMSCDTEEKEVFKKHLTTLQNIPKVNII